MLVLHVFKVSIKLGSVIFWTWFFFYKTILAILGPLHFHIDFSACQFLQKRLLGIWEILCWTYKLVQGETVVFTLLNLPTHDGDFSLHLVRYSLISLSNVFYFFSVQILNVFCYIPIYFRLLVLFLIVFLNFSIKLFIVGYVDTNFF